MQKSFLYYVVRFIGAVFILCAMIYGAGLLLARFAPDISAVIFEGPGALGIAMALFIMPPLTVGQAFYRFEQRRMTAGEGWGLALVCGVLFMAICGGFVWWSLTNNPLQLQQLQADIGEDVVVAAIPLVVLAVFIVLVFKLFFWAAIRGQIKQAARRARTS